MPFGPNDPRNTPPCPQCLTAIGVPFSITHAPGRTIVDFRCPTCRNEWRDQRVSENITRTEQPQAD
jgi:tRNA(Ile2) C34 agmatinyltransferase TiaS